MNAAVLRDFFLGRVTAPQLALDLRSCERMGAQTGALRIANLDEKFIVTTEHLVRLLDAVIAGHVPPSDLEGLGAGIICSGGFTWDGDSGDGARVGEALHDWAAPQINYALTRATAAKFRHRLLTGEDIFDRADLGSASA